ISAWGHDFRPEYQQLARAREALAAERVLALTATATPEVRRDIADALELRDPKVFVAGFDRPNLFIEVLRVSGDKDKLGRLLALARGAGPGIVYAATRKNVEKIVGSLRAAGVDALGYHAGMGDEDRTSVQDRFVRGDAPRVRRRAGARLQRHRLRAVGSGPAAGERRPPGAWTGARRTIRRAHPVGRRRRSGGGLRAPGAAGGARAADAGSAGALRRYA